jgi:hypothetical protein
MDKKKRQFIDDCIYRKLLNFNMDSVDASRISEAVLVDIVTDIEETADEDFTSGDVDIAFTRLLLKTFCKE